MAGCGVLEIFYLRSTFGHGGQIRFQSAPLQKHKRWQQLGWLVDKDVYDDTFGRKKSKAIRLLSADNLQQGDRLLESFREVRFFMRRKFLTNVSNVNRMLRSRLLT